MAPGHTLSRRRHGPPLRPRRRCRSWSHGTTLWSRAASRRSWRCNGRQRRRSWGWGWGCGVARSGACSRQRAPPARLHPFRRDDVESVHGIVGSGRVSCNPTRAPHRASSRCASRLPRLPSRRLHAACPCAELLRLHLRQRGLAHHLDTSLQLGQRVRLLRAAGNAQDLLGVVCTHAQRHGVKAVHSRDRREGEDAQG